MKVLMHYTNKCIISLLVLKNEKYFLQHNMKAKYDILVNYSNEFFNVDPTDPNVVLSNYSRRWEGRMLSLTLYLTRCREIMLSNTPDDTDYGNYDMDTLIHCKSNWQVAYNDLTSMLTDEYRIAHHDWRDIQDNLSNMFNDYSPGL